MKRNRPDTRDYDWFIDKGIQALMFVAGISAIIFIIAIFIFVAKEGLPFVMDRFNFSDFLGSIYGQC